MEHNPEQPNTLKERVFEEIKTRNVIMRSKLYFVFHLVALIAVATLVLIISVLVLSFVFFSIRINEYGSLLQFGPRGFLGFVTLFPWLLLLADIVLVVVLQWLLRKFRFGYDKPFLYMLLGLLIITVSASLLIDRGTGFNDELLRRADLDEIPGPFEGFYIGFRHPPRPEGGVCTCRITAIDGNLLTAEDRHSSTTVTIIVPPDDPSLDTLEVGDTVFVAGDVASGTIRTFGIRRFEREEVR